MSTHLSVTVKQSEVVAFLRLIGVDTSQSYLTDIHIGVTEGTVTSTQWAVGADGERIIIGDGDDRRVASETFSWVIGIVPDPLP